MECSASLEKCSDWSQINRLRIAFIGVAHCKSLPFFSWLDIEERAIHVVRKEWQGKGPECVSVSTNERAYRRFHHIFEKRMESGFQSSLA